LKTLTFATAILLAVPSYAEAQTLKPKDGRVVVEALANAIDSVFDDGPISITIDPELREGIRTSLDVPEGLLNRIVIEEEWAPIDCAGTRCRRVGRFAEVAEPPVVVFIDSIVSAGARMTFVIEGAQFPLDDSEAVRRFDLFLEFERPNRWSRLRLVNVIGPDFRNH
jgi:hypothetical protein